MISDTACKRQLPHASIVAQTEYGLLPASSSSSIHTQDSNPMLMSNVGTIRPKNLRTGNAWHNWSYLLLKYEPKNNTG